MKQIGKKSEAQYGIKASWIRNIGGSTLFGETPERIWSHKLATDRYELWAKRGYFLDKGINRSIGTQFSANYQDLESYFGNRIFNAQEQNVYGNLIVQDNIYDTRYTLKAGIDANWRNLRQDIWDITGDYNILTTGAYAEYSFVSSPDGQGLAQFLVNVITSKILRVCDFIQFQDYTSNIKVHNAKITIELPTVKC